MMNPSMNHYDLVQALFKSQPFIYKINDKYYFLGSDIYRLCTDQEISLYKKYCDAFSVLEKRAPETIDWLTKNDVSEIVFYFNKIISDNVTDCNNQREAKAHNQIQALILSLSDETVKDIFEQRKRREYAYGFVDGILYRYIVDHTQSY